MGEWIVGLPLEERARVLRFIDLLEEQGNKLRMPRSRSLGEGLFELWFPLGRQERRITYRSGARGRIVLLTAFRKQRQAERKKLTGRGRCWSAVRLMTIGEPTDRMKQ